MLLAHSRQQHPPTAPAPARKATLALLQEVSWVAWRVWLFSLSPFFSAYAGGSEDRIVNSTTMTPSLQILYPTDLWIINEPLSQRLRPASKTHHLLSYIPAATDDTLHTARHLLRPLPRGRPSEMAHLTTTLSIGSGLSSSCPNTRNSLDRNNTIRRQLCRSNMNSLRNHSRCRQFAVLPLCLS